MAELSMIRNWCEGIVRKIGGMENREYRKLENMREILCMKDVDRNKRGNIGEGQMLKPTKE